MFTIIFLTTAEGSTCKCKQALLPENTNLSRCHPTSLCPSLPGGCPGAGHGTCARALLHTVLLTPKSLGFSLPWFSPPLSCCRILLFWSLKKKKISSNSQSKHFLVCWCPLQSYFWYLVALAWLLLHLQGAVPSAPHLFSLSRVFSLMCQLPISHRAHSAHTRPVDPALKGLRGSLPTAQFWRNQQSTGGVWGSF